MIWIYQIRKDLNEGYAALEDLSSEEYILKAGNSRPFIPLWKMTAQIFKSQQLETFIIVRTKMFLLRPAFPGLLLGALAAVFQSWLCLVLCAIFLLTDLVLEWGWLFWYFLRRQLKKKGLNHKLMNVSAKKFLEIVLGEMKCHKIRFMNG